ncbi:MAG: cysteine peptidase family C39 domain-containing protein [Halieaceae bacterium]|nr:cysteine peptidase family C39 domain-containing protein [Halieaceae bacterium]
MLAVFAIGLVSPSNAQPWSATEPAVELQQTDFSCGLAALANTLIRLGSWQGSEAQLLGVGESIGVSSATAKVAGYSMAELLAIARTQGFDGVGLRLDMAGLVTMQPPFIVRLETAAGGHFSTVVEIIVRDRTERGVAVRLADPTWGDVTLDAAAFAALWLHQKSTTGVALALRRR